MIVTKTNTYKQIIKNQQLKPVIKSNLRVVLVILLEELDAELADVNHVLQRFRLLLCIWT